MWLFLQTDNAAMVERAVPAPGTAAISPPSVGYFRQNDSSGFRIDIRLLSSLTCMVVHLPPRNDLPLLHRLAPLRSPRHGRELSLQRTPMKPQHLRRIRDIAVAFLQNTIDVFPLYLLERLRNYHRVRSGRMTE